jgi:hypothetical protein
MSHVPLIAFIAAAFIAGALAVRFNVRTYRLVRDIQRVAEHEGTTWTFYGDPQRTVAFLFRPGQLVDSSDSIALRACKESLLTHRRSLGRTLVITWAIMIVGFVLAVGLPLLSYAILQSKFR